MRDYTVIFIEPVDLETLAQAAADAFAIPPGQIEIWNGQDFTAPVIEPVIAQVAPGSGPGAFAEFIGFDIFAEHTGAPAHLQVAIELATRVKKRAVFPPESAEDYRWTLIATDGSYGKVVIDNDKLDEGAIVVSGAVDFIPGAPDLPQIKADSR